MSRNPNPYKRPDHKSREARALGYPARSVFKLEEIDRRIGLLRPGQHVLDLGAAPGSWSMYVAKKLGSSGRLLAIDLQPVHVSLGPTAEFVQGDALSLDNEVIARLAPYDVVLSDMAPSTTGSKEGDAARSAELFLRAAEVGAAFGKPGSSFVGKLFMGAEFEQARARLRELYEQVRCIRPEGTRTNSVEVFLVGLRLKAR